MGMERPRKRPVGRSSSASDEMDLGGRIDFILRLFVICLANLGVSLAVKDAATGYERERVVCPEKTLVYGPGLQPQFNVPARYFFIQAVDTNNETFTYSPGRNAFTVTIGPEGRRGRIQIQLLDRNDGTFIVRYRMYSSYENLHIVVKSGNRHVAGSPYIFKEPAYNEECFCPEEDEEAWEADLHCPTQLPAQIQDDLRPFLVVDLDRAATEIVEIFSKKRRHTLCHYSIIDNKVYRKVHGDIPGFKMFSDATLLSLTRKVRIPDVEIFINLGDWPLEKNSENPLPIFSWCGSDETYDIIMPTYDLTQSVLESMGRVTLDLLSIQNNTNLPWKEREAKGFFRGRDSRQERLDLIDLSRENLELIDAALTNFFFFRDQIERYGPKVPHISFYDFFKYKYQLNIDGTVAAYRFPYLLAGKSTVFKQDSPYYEHFYKQLEPWTHYVPFKRDLSDLTEKIEWAQSHDQEVQDIAKNALKFVQENLMANDILCYHEQLLKEFAKRQSRKPKLYEGMEEVVQPESRIPCDCHRFLPRHEEL